MKRRAVKEDEDHVYYGHSWAKVSAGRIGCVVIAAAIIGVGLPFAWKKWIAPTRAMTRLNDAKASRQEKLDSLRLIRKTEYAPALFNVASRLKDEEEDLAVRGEAVRTLAVFGKRGQETLREVFDSGAPFELKMEILNHMDSGGRQLVEEALKAPENDEFSDACSEWLELHPEGR